MALPFAGGLTLIGPALLTGFFRLAAIHALAYASFALYQQVFPPQMVK